MPEMVQIGNEVRNGMMWPLGRLPDNWDNFAALFKAGVDGIDAGRGRAPRPLIMLHYDNGADTDGTKAFFDRFHEYGIPYDIIGYSYYPWWHGNLLELRDNVLSVLGNYPDKDVILVEAGYRPGEYEMVSCRRSPRTRRAVPEGVPRGRDRNAARYRTGGSRGSSGGSPPAPVTGTTSTRTATRGRSSRCSTSTSGTEARGEA